MRRAICPPSATADLFPAYDDDGGMLLVLPTSGASQHSRCRPLA